MGAPGFWDDQENAAKVSSEHSRASRRLEVFRSLEADAEDLDGLAELAEEDDELAAELEEQIGSVESRLAALEEQRLFSGRYDAGDALVTVNAGAGGTDAQDWAEMVLRMQMRWAERRGFKVELLEASAGEEAGIKSATFRAAGENAYGLYSRREGRAPARAPVALRLRQPAPDVLRGRRGRAGHRGCRRDRDRCRRPAGRHLPGVGRGRSARQQDRLGRAHHAPPERHRRAVPERALADPEPRDRDEDAALQARRARGAPAPGGDRAREGRCPGRQFRLADPLLRPASLHDGQGPPHRPRDGRRSTACSRATSTASCARTCCATPRGSGSGRPPRTPPSVPERAPRGQHGTLEVVARALAEDVGPGDVTARATVPGRARGRRRSPRRRPV